MAEVKKTKAGSHRATERGYASGELIEAGRLVPADTPVSENWMEPTKGSDKLARAIDEAQDPQPDDVDLNQLKGDALTAHAATHGINRNRLSDNDLRAAVRAAYDRDRTQ